MDDKDDQLATTRLKDLQDMGLTYNEALAYSKLVAMGPSRARLISEATHIPRVDAYMILKRLETKGLVEVILDKPLIFVPVDPRDFVRTYLTKMEKRVEEIKQKAYVVREWLEGVSGSAISGVDSISNNPAVRIVPGQQALTETLKMIIACKVECSAIIPHFSSPRPEFLNFKRHLLSAEKRGVRIRMLAGTSEEEFESIHRSLTTLEMKRGRTTEGAGFLLFDRLRFILPLAESRAPPDDTRVIISNVPSVTRLLCQYFDETWSKTH